MQQHVITKTTEAKAGISVEIASSEKTTVLLFKPSFWVKTGLKTGDSFDEDKLDELRKIADFCRAIARAEGMLAASDYSKTKLIHRLLRYGFDRETCEKTAEYAEKKGYIKESEQTHRITRYFCHVKHWGKKRIAAELMGRGYCRDAVMSALNSVTEEEYYSSLEKLVRQKYSVPPEDTRENERRITALSRMGYSYSEINRALKEAGQNEDMD